MEVIECIIEEGIHQMNICEDVVEYKVEIVQDKYTVSIWVPQINKWCLVVKEISNQKCSIWNRLSLVEIILYEFEYSGCKSPKEYDEVYGEDINILEILLKGSILHFINWESDFINSESMEYVDVVLDQFKQQFIMLKSPENFF